MHTHQPPELRRPGEQVAGDAFLDHTTPTHDVEIIRVEQCAELMRHHQHGAVSRVRRQRPHHRPRSLDIGRVYSFIHEEDGRRFEERSQQSDHLALSRRKLATALPNDGEQS